MFEAAFWTTFGAVIGFFAAFGTIGTVAFGLLVGIAAIGSKRKPRGWKPVQRNSIFTAPFGRVKANDDDSAA